MRASMTSPVNKMLPNACNEWYLQVITKTLLWLWAVWFLLFAIEQVQIQMKIYSSFQIYVRYIVKFDIYNDIFLNATKISKFL